MPELQRQPCPTCQASGRMPDGFRCSACRGTRIIYDRPAAAPQVSSSCRRCGGTGRYRTTYSGDCGPCNTCRGTGRASDSAVAARVKKGNELAAKRRAWVDANPAAYAWIKARTGEGNSFALSLDLALDRYGALTPNQLASVQRNIDKTSAPQAQTPRPQASMPEVEKAFASAQARGVRFPKMRLAGLVLSPAGAASANAGAIYVKSDAGVYLGKVLGGVFSKSRECTDEQQAAILEAAKDPKAAAVAYGRETGSCSICARELTDADSIERGIGPVCAERMGW